ncbi:MAG: periplasmic heavy metal sensor [Rhodospirillales bacterium]
MRISRRLAIVLAASIGLNLFLGGMLTAHYLFGDDQKRTRGFFQRDAARAELSEPHRKTVDAIWDKHRPVMRGHLRALRESRREVRRLLRAEKVDTAAIAKARQQYDASQQQVRVSVRRAVDEISAALPDAERRKYFETGFKRSRRSRQ